MQFYLQKNYVDSLANYSYIGDGEEPVEYEAVPVDFIGAEEVVENIKVSEEVERRIEEKLGSKDEEEVEVVNLFGVAKKDPRKGMVELKKKLLF
jgi:hypothetical protein